MGRVMEKTKEEQRPQKTAGEKPSRLNEKMRESLRGGGLSDN